MKEFIDQLFWTSLQKSMGNYNEVQYFEDRFDEDSNSLEDQFNKVSRQGALEYVDQFNTIDDQYNEQLRDQSNEVTKQAGGEQWDQSNKVTRVEEDEFEFVEPMVFDLVRGLGAKPGESEVNYLMIIPLNGDPATFSPGTHSIKLFYKSVDF